MPEDELPTRTRRLLAQDPHRMACLRAARSLELRDWYIGAGFVRNAIWDHLHGHLEPTPLRDVDLVFFDPEDTRTEREVLLEQRLAAAVPEALWEVRNQARMHTRSGDAPYRDCADAIAHWVEAPTAVGVRLEADGAMRFAGDAGLEAAWALQVHPNPRFSGDLTVYWQRVRDKRWQQLWPLLDIQGPGRL